MNDNQTTPLHRAALRWCAAKDREAEIRRRIPVCERGSETMTKMNEDGRPCCQAYVQVSAEDFDPLPQSQWCEPCRRALPMLVELRHVRRQLGGYARAMRQAARKAANPPAVPDGSGGAP